MSECCSHGVVPWRSSAHRQVMKIAFKPQHAAHPEDALSEAEIRRLPPELRELRAFAPQGHVKSIVKSFAAEGAIVLSEPSDAPVTPEELTPTPFHRATAEDNALQAELPIGPPPALPPVVGGFTDEQRYLFDTFGWVKVAGVLEGEELAECQAAAQEYMDTPAEDHPEGLGVTPGGKFLHSLAWAPCLERLAMHPRLWPIVLELTDGKPKMGAASGTM